MTWKKQETDSENRRIVKFGGEEYSVTTDQAKTVLRGAYSELRHRNSQKTIKELSGNETEYEK